MEFFEPILISAITRSFLPGTVKNPLENAFDEDIRILWIYFSVKSKQI
jgi:hypothetical protein